MTPPFVLSGHGMDPKLTPVYRRTGGGILVEETVVNSSGTGVFSWGGQALFPMEPVIGNETPGDLVYGKRQAPGGDSFTVYASVVGGTHPLYMAAAQWDASQSDPADGGIDERDTDITQCISASNSGRFERGAGVIADLRAVFLYRLHESASGSESLCFPSENPTPIVFESVLEFNVHFTG